MFYGNIPTLHGTIGIHKVSKFWRGFHITQQDFRTICSIIHFVTTSCYPEQSFIIQFIHVVHQKPIVIFFIFCRGWLFAWKLIQISTISQKNFWMEWPPIYIAKNVGKCLFQPLIDFFHFSLRVYNILFITFFPILHFKETTDEIIDFLLWHFIE